MALELAMTIIREHAMQIAEIILQILATLIVGGVGAYFSYNYRIQTRLKVLELRIDAYRKLFAITEIASPTRLGRGAQLSEQETKKLGFDIYSWYYENGHRLLMPNLTRRHLQWLQRTLQGEPVEDVTPDPLLREVSKLRTMLRRDVGIFGKREWGWHRAGRDLCQPIRFLFRAVSSHPLSLIGSCCI